MPTVTSPSKGSPGPSIEEHDLARGRQLRALELLLDLDLARRRRRPRSRRGCRVATLSASESIAVVRSAVDHLAAISASVVDLLQLRADLRPRSPWRSSSSASDLLAEAARRPAEVGLEDLPDVHARRHAQRVQHDVDRRAVGHVRHVLLGEDPRDDALVAVAAGHLVADRELALDGDVDLHHLEHARRQLVALASVARSSRRRRP